MEPTPLKQQVDIGMVARIRELERLLSIAVSEKESWRAKTTMLAGTLSDNLCEMRDQINQMSAEYQEDIAYTKEYFEDRMRDLVKACSRQASKDLLELEQSASSRQQ